MPTLPRSLFFGGRGLTNGVLVDHLNTAIDTAAEAKALAEALEDIVGPENPNVVFVYEKSDFPTPVLGKIALDPLTYYIIQAPINLGTDVLTGSTVRLIGTGSDLSEISTASAQPLLKTDGTGDALLINGVDVKNFGGGAVLDLDQNPPLGAVLLFTMNLTSVGKSIIIRDSVLLTMDSCFLVSNDGMEIVGTVGQTVMQNVSCFSLTGAPDYTAFSVLSTANTDIMNLRGCLFSMFNAPDYAMYFDPGATYQRPVRISSCNYTPAAQAIDPAGRQVSHPYLISESNSGLPASVFAFQAVFNGNTQVTNLAVQNTKYPIGTGNPSHPLLVITPGSQRFSLNGATEMQNQTIVVDSVETHPYRLSAKLQLIKAGSAETYEASLYIDGVEMVNSRSDTEVVSGSARPLLLENIVEMPNSAEIEVRISCTTVGGAAVQVRSISIIAQRL